MRSANGNENALYNYVCIQKALKAYDEKDRQAKLRKHKERRGARKAQLENMIASDVEQNPASSAGGGSDEHRHRSDSGEQNELANGVTVYMESLELPTPAQSAQQQRAQRCQSQNSNPANAADADDDDDEDGSKKGMDRYSKQRQWNQTGNANKAAGTPSTGRPSGSKQKERLEKAKKRMHSRQGVSKKQKSTNSSKAGKKKTRIKKKQKS